MSGFDRTLLGCDCLKKAPNTKLQAPEKLQTSSSKLAGDRFGIWDLEFLWSLVFGFWSFISCI